MARLPSVWQQCSLAAGDTLARQAPPLRSSNRLRLPSEEQATTRLLSGQRATPVMLPDPCPVCTACLLPKLFDRRGVCLTGLCWL